MSKKILSWLSESISETEKAKGELPIAEIDKRIAALGEVFTAPTSTQLKEAMTTAHFSTYFSTALDREFMTAYQTKVGSWKQYTYADTSPDLRDVYRARMEYYGNLHLRREKAESKASYMTDSWIHYGADEYSDQLDISWQTLLNDDLNEIKKVPQNLAAMAAEFEDMFVSNLYDNATTQATLAGLGAPWSGTGRLTAANLAIGLSAMRTRTRPNGKPMYIRSVYLVIPPDLEIQARVILNSALMAGVATNDKNVLPEFISGVYVDPYIATASPNIPWYLFAAPSEIPAVPVVRLQGVSGPFTYMKEPEVRVMSGSAPSGFDMGSFATGDISYGVSTLIGGWDDTSYVGVADFRGIYYSSGTTA